MNSNRLIRSLFSPISISLFIVLGLNLRFLSLASISSAQTVMSNGQYEVHMGTLNSFSGKVSNNDYKLNATGGNMAPSKYTGSNYIVAADYPYSTRPKPFSFSISSFYIDFGPITPGAPVTRNQILSVSPGTARGYTVVAYENQPLREEKSGEIIPDTTCDDGGCDEKTAFEWTNILTYGFGYRCDNIEAKNCLEDFSQPENYKQFPNNALDEPAEVVMRGTSNAEAEAEITYKVNIPASQASGNYKNSITFIALPSL